MIVSIPIHTSLYQADLSKPIIASFPLQAGNNNPSAFHLPMPHFSPFSMGDFIGSTALGGPVNCSILVIAPHGNGTHTECVGHISKQPYYIAHTLKTFNFFGLLLTLSPIKASNGDMIISKEMIHHALENHQIPEALMIRTFQKDRDNIVWSGNNPPYFTADAMEYIAHKGIQHFLTDLPSVDPEIDNGELAAHHAFWQYPDNIRTEATITEMVNLNNDIRDGIYLVSIHIAPLLSDASPSTIVLYELFAQNI
jgi:kynurenine formamidase